MQPNQSISVILPPGQQLTVTLGTGASCHVIERTTGGAPLTPVTVTATPTTLGPYSTLKWYTLIAVNGTVDYVTAPFVPIEFLDTITLAQSGVAVASINNTSEQTLVTIPVPANLMGINGALYVTALWSLTNNANAKALRIRFGGTEFQNLAGASLVTVSAAMRIQNRGSLTSQVGASVGMNAFGATSTAAVVTSTLNTGVSQDLTISVQKATGTDTATLEAYTVQLLRDYNI
jgi:hypothetical protein